MAQRRLADAVRAAGCSVFVEAEPDASDRGGWRDDVLAVGNDGRRFAFEAQLAPMTASEGAERSARYHADGIGCVWITTKAASWLYHLPGAQVGEATDTSSMAGGRVPIFARRGLAQLPAGRPESGWEACYGVPLLRLVAGLLTGRVVSHTLQHLYETVQAGSQERTYWHNRAVVLAPAQHVRDDQRYEEHLVAERARAAVEDAERARNIERLYQRQRLALPTAISDALVAARPEEGVWLGVPPTDTRRDGDISLERAYGNDKTARAATVWLGATKGDLRLFAVVCPVASRITIGLAHSWHHRGVRVYVTELREARRVAESLGWALSTLHFVGES